MDFLPGLVAPRVGVLDRTGLTILCALFLSFQYCFRCLCLAMFVHVRQDVERHVVEHLGPDICQNFNWYQSRHPVLFLGEILGKILSGHGQGRRFILKRCLNLEKFIWL